VNGVLPPSENSIAVNNNNNNNNYYYYYYYYYYLLNEGKPMHGRAKFRSVSLLIFLVSTLQTGRTDELILLYLCV